MANISGNPVWKDYPDTTTLIDAEALNNLETGLNNAATTAEWGKLTGVPTAFTPTAHAASHSEGGSDPVTPASIGALESFSTGWRSLPLENGWTGTVEVIRIEHGVVHVAVAQLDGTGSTSDVFVTLPPGFRSRRYTSVFTVEGTSPQTSPAGVVVQCSSTFAGGSLRAPQSVTNLYFSATLHSVDALPVEPYPGTPA